MQEVLLEQSANNKKHTVLPTAYGASILAHARTVREAIISPVGSATATLIIKTTAQEAWEGLAGSSSSAASSAAVVVALATIDTTARATM